MSLYTTKNSFFESNNQHISFDFAFFMSSNTKTRSAELKNAYEMLSNFVQTRGFSYTTCTYTHTTRSRCIVFKPKSQHHTPKLIHSFKGFVPKFTCMTRKIPFCSVFIGKTKKSFDDLIYNLLVISIDLNKN